MENRKRIAVMAVVLALIVAGVIFVPIKREINQDFTCYACHQDDPDYREEVTVNFTGTITDYLLLPDRFEGFIDVTPFTYMTEDFCPDGTRQLDLTLKPDECAHIIYLIREEFEPGRVKTTFTARGMIRTDEDLSSFQLGYFVRDPDDSNSRTMKVILSYPESLSWEEAEAAIYAH